MADAKTDTKDTTKKEPKVVIFARYVGDGKQFFIDVPARDLTKEDFERLPTLAQRDVLAGTIYKVADSGEGGAN